MDDDPRLTNLLSYTIFHIGVYISLVTAIISIGVLSSEIDESILRFSAGCILLAGVFGGTIGSNAAEAMCYGKLEEDKLKVFDLIPVAKLQTCIHLEHLFFWMGIGVPALAFIFGGSSALG